MTVDRKKLLARYSRLKRKKENYDLLDIDYLDKLSDEELAWYLNSLKTLYEGPGSGFDSRSVDLAYVYRPPLDTPRRNTPSYSLYDWQGTSPTPEDILLVSEEIEESGKK